MNIKKHEINKGDPPLYSQLITLTISRTALEDIEKIIYFDIQCNKIQMLMIYQKCNFPMTPPSRWMVGQLVRRFVIFSYRSTCFRNIFPSFSYPASFPLFFVSSQFYLHSYVLIDARKVFNLRGSCAVTVHRVVHLVRGACAGRYLKKRTTYVQYS